MSAIRRILVPVDFSPGSNDALEYAVALAERLGASVLALHVWELLPYFGPAVLVNVPEEIMRFIRSGIEVRVRAGGKENRGKVFAIIPQGDISTRTFPVKVRMNNTHSLVEGMEARVNLPTNNRRKTLIVPRDAVLNLFGKNVVFAIVDSKARLMPVRVIGYQGNQAGVEGEGLAEGMKVAIKGNERLQDGQAVTILNRNR